MSSTMQTSPDEPWIAEYTLSVHRPFLSRVPLFVERKTEWKENNLLCVAFVPFSSIRTNRRVNGSILDYIYFLWRDQMSGEDDIEINANDPYSIDGDDDEDASGEISLKAMSTTNFGGMRALDSINPDSAKSYFLSTPKGNKNTLTNTRPRGFS